MPAPKKISVPADRLRHDERLVAAVGGAKLKSNFGSAYTAVNGNMYSMISKHGLVGIRLPAEEHAAFRAKYDAALFRGDPAWPPAKEYVAVPDQLLEDTERLRPYLEIALRYVSTMPPKPTKRP